MNYITESYETHKETGVHLTVCQSGWQKCSGKHSFGPAVRDHYVIHYIIEGKGTYYVNGKEYPLRAGDGFLITPGQSTTYAADESDPWEYYWVGFRGVDVVRLLHLCGMDEEHPIFTYRKDDRVHRHLSDLYFASKQYESREYAMVGYLYLFFSCLIPLQSAKNKPREVYLNRSIRYIQENTAYPITVEDIANQVGVERSYLYRIFMEELHCSVHDYVMHCKIERAKEMMSQNQFTLAEIACSLGFSDSSHFSKTFKKIVGESPSRYRSHNM